MRSATTDAGCVLGSRTTSGESEQRAEPHARPGSICKPDVLCIVRRGDWEGRQEVATEGGEHFTRGCRSHRGLEEVGVGSAGSVSKVKKRSGGLGGGLHCFQIKGEERRRASHTQWSHRECGESETLQRLEGVCSTERHRGSERWKDFFWTEGMLPSE